jgi:nitroimidazol reductase NimA-like FMN-containing flavoprotein (pyridoxamine 5'-phosphate oxidase superfamily)
MGSIDRTTAMEHLTQAECWQLLARHAVGRLGVTARTGPEIYPVNYVVDDEAITFRTDPGGKLASLAGTPAVCFEIDHIDAEARAGWSVLVKGRARQLHPAEQESASALPLDYWTIGTKAHWIRIEPTEVTGRSIWQATAPAARPAGDGIDVLDPLFVRPGL